MDGQSSGPPATGKLRAIINICIHSKSTHKRPSSLEPCQDDHVDKPKKNSKLRRLGQGVRRWRARHGRKRSVDNSNNIGGGGDGTQEQYQHSRSFSSSGKSTGSDEATVVGDDAPPGCTPTTPLKHVHLDVKVSCAGQADVASTDVEKDQRGNGQSDTTKAKETGISSSPTETTGLVMASEKTPSAASLAISTPQCEYIRKRKEAKQFANSITHSPPTSSAISTRSLIYWTDASLRRTQSNQVCGGIAVAQRQHNSRWQVEYAHAVGLARIELLECLAILQSLKIALLKCRGTESIFILSDGASLLKCLEKVLSLFSAMEEAHRELQASKCDARAVVSFSQAFEFSKLDKYTGKDIQAALWYVVSLTTMPSTCFLLSLLILTFDSPILSLQAVEIYSRLRQMGTTVRFHWVSGHSGIVGSEIADRWSFKACLWFAEASIALTNGEAKVIPLEPIEFGEPWHENCQLLSRQRPETATLSLVLDRVKRLQFVLKVESEDETASPKENKKREQSRIPEEDAALATERQQPKKARAKCTAWGKRGHGREQCGFSHPCSLCKETGHAEQRCPQKRKCPVCGELVGPEHSRKRCRKIPKRPSKARKARKAALMPAMMPDASLLFSLAPPTLMDRKVSQGAYLFQATQIGLKLHLAPNVKISPKTVSDCGPEID